MNERIRELAVQAGIDLYGLTGIEATQANLQEFAELIVNECMEVARQRPNPQNLNYKPSERFVEDLQQHFGVK